MVGGSINMEVVTSQLIQMVMGVASSINLSAGGDLTFNGSNNCTVLG
jgi:hypothetical protein